MRNGNSKFESTTVARAETSLTERGTDELAARLTRVISEMARGLAGKPDMEATVSAITANAVHAVPGAAYAGVTRLVSRGRMVVHASADAVADELERLQAGLHQGPSVAALRQHRIVSIAEMAGERRWPDFTEAAMRLGVASMLSLRLFLHEKTFGVLNLYATTPHAFTDGNKILADAFAAHAAIALHNAAESQGLREAIASRDVIGQAKGILMERHRAIAADAFDVLVAASQRSNLKLIDVARRLVDKRGSLDPGSPGADAQGVRLRPPATIAGISGEIDTSNVDDVGRYVARLISTSRTLVLDLSDVQFFSVAGLYLLDSIGEQCAKAELEWALVSSDAVKSLLRVAGCDDRLPIAESVATALERLSGSSPARHGSRPITAPDRVRC